MFKKSIVILTLVTLLFSIPVMANEGDNSSPSKNEPKLAAVVNGQDITINELDQFANLQQIVMSLYQQHQQFAQVLLQSEEGQELLNRFRKTKLDGLISQTLLEQEAKKRGISISDKDKDDIFNQQISAIKRQNNLTDDQLKEVLKKQGINSLEQYKEVFFQNNEQNLVINKLREEVTSDINVSDKEIEEYYNNNKSNYKHDEQVKASHILVEKEEKAKELIDKLNSGANFTELAKNNSTGPSAKNGGNLGFFSKKDMVEPFTNAAFNLNVGEISEKPVKTQYGYHIIKVTDKKEAGTTSLSDAKAEIKQKLQQQKMQDAWNKFVKSLREEAKIEKKL